MVLGRIVLAFVHTEHNGDVLILGWRGNDDFLYGSTEVLARRLGICESSGGLDHNLRSDRLPIEVGRILLGEHSDSFAANLDAVLTGRNIFRKISEHRVVLEQMRQCFGVGKVIYGYKLDLGMVQCGTHNVASDAAKPINSYLDCH